MKENDTFWYDMPMRGPERVTVIRKAVHDSSGHERLHKFFVRDRYGAEFVVHGYDLRRTRRR